jgi:thiol-disulfide isomerase/thioredoxin
MTTPLFAAMIFSVAGLSEPVKLTPVEKGASAKIGSYRPVRAELSADKPATVTKLPEGLTAPRFAALPFKSESGAVFHLVLDEPEGKPATLLIDTNGNGDLTDDPATEWKGETREGPEGKKSTMYAGAATVAIGEKDAPFNATIRLYRFDPTDEARAQLKNTVLFYRDYALEGEVNVGGKTRKAMLVDDGCTGDFRGAANEGGRSGSGVTLMLDANGNGKFDRRGESFDVRKPFNIGGVTYELQGMTRLGAFTIAVSEKQVDEVPTPPDHGVGKKIMAFTATTMDGKEINFPADYKGKVVMLDFWATWCGPCMVEVPGLVKAYGANKTKGFELLGISLDREDAEKKVREVMADKGMDWPQVYDGKFWQARVAQLYAIDSIPACYLVDGDTGEILADSRSLRGEKLAETIKAALEKKFPAGN